MTRDEQRQFVLELSDNIATSILTQIDKGIIPEHWDGIELRALLAYRHDKSSAMGMHGNLRRKRAFNNDVAIYNL